MNTFRTVSRVLVVAAVAFVGNACAMKDAPTFKLPDLKNTTHYKIVNDNKYAYMGSFVADRLCDEDADAEKALVETFGHLMDRKNSKLSGIDLQVDGAHLAVNYTIRKATRALNRNGVTLKSAGDVAKAVVNKVDYLPKDGIMRDAANFTSDNIVKPVVSTVAEQATKPEVLTLATLYVGATYIVPFVLSAWSSK